MNVNMNTLLQDRMEYTTYTIVPTVIRPWEFITQMLMTKKQTD